MCISITEEERLREGIALLSSLSPCAAAVGKGGGLEPGGDADSSGRTEGRGGGVGGTGLPLLRSSALQIHGKPLPSNLIPTMHAYLLTRFGSL